MNLLRFFRTISFALIALLAVAPPPCRADGALPPSDPNLISIEFAGGPLSKLVATFNSDKDTKLSIIQSEGLDPVLPAFSVHHVRINEIVSALGRLLEPQGFQLAPMGPNLAVLFQFARHTSQDFASLQLERKLGASSVEEVVSAIEAGCEFASQNAKASTLRFKYHPGTKLLFVAGTEQEVGIAHRVFDSLPDNPAKAPPPSDKK
jgi:hypothetical protein